MISPFSKSDKVDHTQTEQTSITRFIEDNWHTGRIGDASFDRRANTLSGLFDFRHPNNTQVLLKSDGSVASVHKAGHYTTSALAADAPIVNAAAANALTTRRLADDRGTSVALPIGLTAGVLVLGGAGTALALHRRRTVRTAG